MALRPSVLAYWRPPREAALEHNPALTELCRPDQVQLHAQKEHTTSPPTIKPSTTWTRRLDLDLDKHPQGPPVATANPARQHTSYVP